MAATLSWPNYSTGLSSLGQNIIHAPVARVVYIWMIKTHADGLKSQGIFFIALPLILFAYVLDSIVIVYEMRW